MLLCVHQGAHGTWSPDGKLIARTTFERRDVLGGAFAPAVELVRCLNMSVVTACCVCEVWHRPSRRLQGVAIVMLGARPRHNPALVATPSWHALQLPRRHFRQFGQATL